MGIFSLREINNKELSYVEELINRGYHVSQTDNCDNYYNIYFKKQIDKDNFITVKIKESFDNDTYSIKTSMFHNDSDKPLTRYNSTYYKVFGDIYSDIQSDVEIIRNHFPRTVEELNGDYSDHTDDDSDNCCTDGFCLSDYDFEESPAELDTNNDATEVDDFDDSTDYETDLFDDDEKVLNELIYYLYNYLDTETLDDILYCDDLLLLLKDYGLVHNLCNFLHINHTLLDELILDNEFKIKERLYKYLMVVG